MRHNEAFQCGGAPESTVDDAWARMADSMVDTDSPVADGHGPDEDQEIFGHEDKVSVPLRHVSTAKLKSALLTTAVHIVRCGGERLSGVTASGIRNANRKQVLRAVLDVHAQSEDYSQMLAIAIEHAIH